MKFRFTSADKIFQICITISILKACAIPHKMAQVKMMQRRVRLF